MFINELVFWYVQISARIYWVEDMTQSVLNVYIKFDAWKYIENSIVIERKKVKIIPCD